MYETITNNFFLMYKEQRGSFISETLTSELIFFWGFWSVSLQEVPDDKGNVSGIADN